MTTLPRRRRHLTRSHSAPEGKSRLGRSPSVLSLEEIASLAAAAGFSGDDLPIAVAVAKSESGGDPGAHNPEGSYGLWQIYVPAHPEYAAAASSGALYDPPTNAGAAFNVYSDSGQSFYPWTDYKNSKYLAWLPAAQDAVMADARGDVRLNDTGDLPIAAAAVDLPPGAYLPTSTTPVVLVLAIGAVFLGVKIVKDLFD